MEGMREDGRVEEGEGGGRKQGGGPVGKLDHQTNLSGV